MMKTLTIIKGVSRTSHKFKIRLVLDDADSKLYKKQLQYQKKIFKMLESRKVRKYDVKEVYINDN